MLGCNIFIPQVLWLKKFRVSTGWLWLISFIVLVGMWLERFIIIVVSLSRDFLNSSWGMYYPTKWDWMTFIGTIGLFLTGMWLFVRILPHDLHLRIAHLAAGVAGARGGGGEAMSDASVHELRSPILRFTD